MGWFEYAPCGTSWSAEWERRWLDCGKEAGGKDSEIPVAQNWSSFPPLDSTASLRAHHCSFHTGLWEKYTA